METIPALPGAYALQFSLPLAEELAIGRFGVVHLPAGEYIYLGSARGPGGLRVRLGRHLGPPPSNRRWHIDGLHAIAQASAYCYILDRDDESNSDPGAPPRAIECLWSQALTALPGATVPMRGFGASDCRQGCRAHLVAFPPAPQAPTPFMTAPNIRALLASAADIPLEDLVCSGRRNPPDNLPPHPTHLRYNGTS